MKFISAPWMCQHGSAGLGSWRYDRGLLASFSMFFATVSNFARAHVEVSLDCIKAASSSCLRSFGVKRMRKTLVFTTALSVRGFPAIAGNYREHEAYGTLRSQRPSL